MNTTNHVILESLKSNSRILSKEKQILFAIMVEEFDGRNWTVRYEYMHGIDSAHIRSQFIQANWNRNVRIANVHGHFGIAPVLGYKVHDNHGEKLSV
jgi:hypothetical protein